MKYFLITDNDLNNHLLSRGYEPIHSNSEKSIYVKNEEVHMDIIGWCQDNNRFSKYNKGHYTINTERELEINLIMMGVK